MLEWESAGGRFTNNSRAKILRCTCSPRRLAGRALRCKGGLRRARDKGSRDSNKGGQAIDVVDWEEFHMELEEGAGLMEGSESLTESRGQYLGRRGGNSIQSRWMPFGKENRLQTREAEAYRPRRSRDERWRIEVSSVQLAECHIFKLSLWILGPGYKIWHTTHKHPRVRQAFGYQASGTFIARCLPWEAGSRGFLPRSFAGWTCGWLLY